MNGRLSRVSAALLTAVLAVALGFLGRSALTAPAPGKEKGARKAQGAAKEPSARKAPEAPKQAPAPKGAARPAAVEAAPAPVPTPSFGVVPQNRVTIALALRNL
ncbi:MAG: hypothetical protein NTW86_06345, partial [Candidatus Sumerlaeota bacterium]|nr:hypothetical protein [Candidatus Sumerlaeota bacterium]